MKNVWSVVGAIVLLFVLYELWEAFSASGGVSGLLGSTAATGTASTVSSTPVGVTAPVSAYFEGPAPASSYTPLGGYASVPVGLIPSSVWGNSPAQGPVLTVPSASGSGSTIPYVPAQPVGPAYPVLFRQSLGTN